MHWAGKRALAGCRNADEGTIYPCLEMYSSSGLKELMWSQILWWLNQDASDESLPQCDAIPCGRPAFHIYIICFLDPSTHIRFFCVLNVFRQSFENVKPARDQHGFCLCVGLRTLRLCACLVGTVQPTIGQGP